MLNEKQHEMTPLQKKLQTVAILIGKIGIAAGIFTFLGLLVRWLIDFENKGRFLDWKMQLFEIAEFFVVAVTIVVVAVPEGYHSLIETNILIFRPAFGCDHRIGILNVQDDQRQLLCPSFVCI
jgi:magnesium-transporting ATPase (P-type)